MSVRRLEQISPEDLKRIQAKVLKKRIQPRIDMNPVSPVIDYITDTMTGGNRDKVLVDYSRTHFEVNVSKLAAQAPEVFANHILVRASRRIISEIPRRGSHRPKHGWKVRTPERCRYQWRLNRPAYGNTRVTLALTFVLVPREMLAESIRLGLCQPDLEGKATRSDPFASAPLEEAPTADEAFIDTSAWEPEDRDNSGELVWTGADVKDAIDEIVEYVADLEAALDQTRNDTGSAE